ncbi:MAG: patatin-like phospholipase family protein, partial [Bacteroidota bacterium]
SAVPMVLSPITFNNYGGSCDYQYPGWVNYVTDQKHRKRPDARAYQRYLEMKSFQDSDSRPFIHLVDGGVSDNIGVRAVLETLEQLRISAEFRGEIGFGKINKVILMVVNAHSSPDTKWDQNEDPPGFFSQLLQSTGVPIDRYSFETIETMKDRAEIMKWRRELQVANKRLAGVSKAEAEASVSKLDMKVVDISFDAINDPSERDYFMNLPTSFFLPSEDIDSLREIAGILLRQSEQYQLIIDSFNDEIPPGNK